MPVEMFGGNLALCGHQYAISMASEQEMIDNMYRYELLESHVITVNHNDDWYHSADIVNVQLTDRFKSHLNCANPGDYIVGNKLCWRAGTPLPNPNRHHLIQNSHYVTGLVRTFNFMDKVKRLDLSEWDTFSVVTMSGFLSDCHSLEYVNMSFDLSALSRDFWAGGGKLYWDDSTIDIFLRCTALQTCIVATEADAAILKERPITGLPDDFVFTIKGA